LIEAARHAARTLRVTLDQKGQNRPWCMFEGSADELRLGKKAANRAVFMQIAVEARTPLR